MLPWLLAAHDRAVARLLARCSVLIQAGVIVEYVLRARKRSSDRTAIAFTRRTETGVGVLALRVPGLNGLGDEMDEGTLEETAEGEE